MLNAIDKAVLDGQENRAAVLKFFLDNPCHSNSDCAVALGLSAKTVGAHCRAIKAGWRPQAEGAQHGGK